MSASEITAQRLQVAGNGWIPIPVTSPDYQHPKVKNPGKQPFFKGWNDISAETITKEMIRGWERIRDHTNTGLKCGHLAGADTDIRDHSLAATIAELEDHHLGTTPLVRIGLAPKQLRCYRHATPLAKMETPELFLPDGSMAQVEIMGIGQQVVGFGVHPDTREAYLWLGRSPLDTRFEDIPVITEAAARAFLAAAEAAIRAAGGRTKKEIEADAVGPEATAKPNGKSAHGANGTANGASFFKQVNRAALDNLAAWVLRLFPRAALQATGAYRVRSTDLGRDYQEDLSIHPDGVQDFGPRKGLSPCDVVMEWGGAPTVQAAALTLCEWLGRDPAGLGWNARSHKPNGADAGRQPPPDPPPPDDDDAKAEQQSEARPNNPGQDNLPPLLSLPDFMATFKTPDYLVDGILQRGRLYALTSPTGHGKTAVVQLFGIHVAAHRNIGNIEVTQGPVIFLAGENPDDLCCRMHAACQVYGLDPTKVPLHVMPGNFPLSPEAAEDLKAKINATGINPVLVIADTAIAFFPGDDDNANVPMGAYARNLRVLTTCNGNPAVLVPTHPIKNPDKDNLTPRGGGAFLNELDGNLTLWAEAMGETATLHWQGKLRGADFPPVSFALQQVKITTLLDQRRRPIVSIVATLQTTDQAEAAAKRTLGDEDTVLELLRRHPGTSERSIAANAGWVSDKGTPHGAKVHRLLNALKKDKLVKIHRRKWCLTDAGKRETEAK